MGSFIDSLLGATLQFSGFDQDTGLVTGKPGPRVLRIAGLPLMSNDAVNLVSAAITSALGAALCVVARARF